MRYLISRNEAKRRIRNRYYAQIEANPQLEPIWSLGHFLTHNNIEAVRRFDLYREYRDRQIIRAWRADDTGGPRQ